MTRDDEVCSSFLIPRVRVWARSDEGLVREHNEDSFLAAPALGLCVIADGMGGHQGGETASALAVGYVHIDVQAHADLLASMAPAPDVAGCRIAKLLGSAIRGANSLIHRRSREARELFGMGTTTTALLLRGERALIAHVGDSRAYLVRSGCATRLTEDHTLIAEHVRDGLVSAEDARASRYRNMITRSVGCEDSVDVDVVGVDVREGDALVLCTDGLTNVVEDSEIAETVTDAIRSMAHVGASDDELHELGQRAVDALVARALQRGGQDNVTVVLARIEDGVTSEAWAPHGSRDPSFAGGAAAGLLEQDTDMGERGG